MYADVFAAVDCDASTISNTGCKPSDFLADDDSLAAFGMPSEAAGFYRGWMTAGGDGRIGSLLQTVVDNGGDVLVINSPEDGKIWEATYQGLHKAPFTSLVVRNVMHDGTPCVALKAAADNAGAGKISNSVLKGILAAGGMNAASISQQISALDVDADDFVSTEEVTTVMGVSGEHCQPLTSGKLSLCSGIGEHIGFWIAEANATSPFGTIDALAGGTSAICNAYESLPSPATQADGCGAPEGTPTNATGGSFKETYGWGSMVALAAAAYVAA